MFGQAQEHFALSAGDPGCGVQQPIPEGLGFCAVQLGLVGEQHRLGQGEQVRGDQGEFGPDFVDVLVPGGQVPEAGVLAGSDPVLDPGVRAVAGFQERQLPAGCVGGEGLVAVAVADLERVQGRAP